MEEKNIKLFRQVLSLRNYADRTINNYVKGVTNYFGFSNSENISQDKLYNYAIFLNTKKLSYSHIKNSVMAVKLFSEIILGKKLHSNFLSKYRRERKLPEVLSIDEVKQILNIIENLKHRTILSLIYSCGLRISEAINLKVVDIDLKIMVVKIVQSKGNKDRYVPLSEKMLLLLREYYKEFKPDNFLFRGQVKENYSARSIQAILKTTLAKTKIKKKITVHSLRHSYAAHLLEQGTDIALIQKILGHKDIKTTLLYAQISKSQLANIANPFDKF